MVSGSSAGVGEVGSSPSDWKGEDVLAVGSCHCPSHTWCEEGWRGVYHLD